MKTQLLAVTPLAIALVATSSFGQAALAERRDNALNQIQACLRRNEVSSRECRKLNSAVEALVDVYQQGDKSVLPTLLKFTYLTRFYGDALLSDRDGFLTAASRLPEPDQRAVAHGVAGGMFRLPKERFEAIQRVLADVPQSSPLYGVATTFLQTTRTNNAALFLDYFPPQTFTSRAADFQVYWYSRDLFALGEKPFWPASSQNETSYRMTVLPAFSGPRTAVLTILPDGRGRIRVKVIGAKGQIETEKTGTVPPHRVVAFSAQLNDLGFWDLPTESPTRGFDGAEFILEGAGSSRYHITVRWCPGKTPFGDLAQSIFELAGYKLDGC